MTTIARLRICAVPVLLMMLLLASQRLSEASAPGGQQPGSASGVIVDETGAPVSGATIRVSVEGAPVVETPVAADGRFTIPNMSPGRFQLRVTAPGFAAQTINAVISTGERLELPPLRLRLAVDAVTVDVTPSQVQVAEEQIREQEQQRVIGIVPNFYVSFVADAAPLNARQKFELSWKASIDLMQFVGVAAVAGVQQARHQFPAFGWGLDGYGKRFAAAYATETTQRLFSRVLVPTIFKQDPRYFYNGTGSAGSRVTYALTRSLVRKGDNGRWQPNYSSILGSFAAAALSNLYYPEEDRKGLGLTFENVGIGIASAALENVAQEFLWSKLTTRHHHKEASRPHSP